MNCWTTTWCFILATILVPSVSTADRVIPTDRVHDRVIIYRLAKVKSAEVGQLRPGESLEFLKSVPRWYAVRLADGSTGFVSKSWTRVVRDGLAERQSNELRIHFLNIGAGTCSVVECPGANNPAPMIVDCGSLSGTDKDMTREAARTYVGEILDSHSTKPNLVLSHADRDHYGWIATVLAGRQMQNIWQGGDPGAYSEDGFLAWIADQRAKGAAIHSRNELPASFHNGNKSIGNSLSCGDAAVFVLTVNSGSTTNAASLVIDIRYEDFGVIFTGDAEGSTERDAITNFDGNVKTTVLSGSHHGARTHGSNSARWAAATFPNVVIFSAGQRFGHPQCDAVDRYTTSLSNAPVHPTHCGEGSDYKLQTDSTRATYMTEINGRIVITTNGRSPLSLFCTGSIGCNAQITH